MTKKRKDSDKKIIKTTAAEKAWKVSSIRTNRSKEMIMIKTTFTNSNIPNKYGMLPLPPPDLRTYHLQASKKDI
jgi:hypothetical protein